LTKDVHGNVPLKMVDEDVLNLLRHNLAELEQHDEGGAGEHSLQQPAYEPMEKLLKLRENMNLAIGEISRKLDKKYSKKAPVSFPVVIGHNFRLFFP
jgi:hypothetical protein